MMIQSVLNTELSIDWSGVLLSNVSARVSEMPFAVFECRNFFPQYVYEALSLSFPVPDERWTNITEKLDSKIDLSSLGDDFWEVVHQLGVWESFVRHLQSKLFIQDILKMIFPILREYEFRGLLANQALQTIMREENDARAENVLYRLEEVLSPEMHFAVMKKGDQNTPHADGSRKAVSIIFYFPENGWNNNFGGGTLFYKVPNGFENCTWYQPRSNRVAPKFLSQFLRDATIGHNSMYKSNHVSMFVKATNSFHAVAPISAPFPFMRRAFLYTLKLENI